jgi:very-short-patch-repair endonuclease
MGIDVIRFSNREIDENFNGVCEKIDLVIKERGTSPVTR